MMASPAEFGLIPAIVAEQLGFARITAIVKVDPMSDEPPIGP